MRKLLLLALLICGCVLLGAQVSVAAIATDIAFTLDDSEGDTFFGGTTGGFGSRPFEASGWTEDTGATPLDPIYTFCVQQNEYFNPTGKGDVVEVASYGTVTQAKDPDLYITGYAAWVYNKFLGMIGATGGVFEDVSLSTYGVGGDPYSTGGSQLTLADMSTIQNAIWAGMVNGFVKNAETNQWMIGDYSLVTAAASIVLSNLVDIGTDAYEADVAANDDIDGLYDIGRARVAVMVDTSDNNKQDQILLGDDLQKDTPPVPEPTTFVIWSLLGGVGFGLARRRRG